MLHLKVCLILASYYILLQSPARLLSFQKSIAFEIKA